MAQTSHASSTPEQVLSPGQEEAAEQDPCDSGSNDPGADVPPMRNEWLLVVFTALTNLADAVTRVALPLLAVQLTRSPGLIAVVGVVLTLPWLVTALHVGVLVDRVNRRTLMVSAETARLLSVGALLGAVLLETTSLPLVYLVALVLGVAQVVALTAGSSIVPAAVPRRRWQHASARITAMEYLCNAFLGAPVGGFLVAAGFVLAFGFTGVVYAVGMVLLALLIGHFTPKPAAGETTAPSEPAARRSVNQEIRDGVRFLWRNQLLRTMALLIAVMAGCWSVWLALIPAYAASPGPLHLGPREYGFLLTCLGAGGVAGTIMVGPVNRLLGRRWSMFADIIGSFLLVAAPTVLPAARLSAVPVGVAAFVAGVGGTMWTVNARVIIQTLVPDHMLGRFNAAYRLISWGTTPVAAAVGGVLAQFAGYHVAFGVFAAGCIALVVPYLRVVTGTALAGVDSPTPAGTSHQPRSHQPRSHQPRSHQPR